MTTFDDQVRAVKQAEGDLLLTKHRDYGPTNIANAPGGALNGLAVRLHDKLARLSHLLDTGVDPEHEPLIDTVRDIANYGTIATLVLQGDWPGAGTQPTPDRGGRVLDDLNYLRADALFPADDDYWAYPVQWTPIEDQSDEHGDDQSDPEPDGVGPYGLKPGDRVRLRPGLEHGSATLTPGMPMDPDGQLQPGEIGTVHSIGPDNLVVDSQGDVMIVLDHDLGAEDVEVKHARAYAVELVPEPAPDLPPFHAEDWDAPSPEPEADVIDLARTIRRGIREGAGSANPSAYAIAHAATRAILAKYRVTPR